MWTAPHIQAHQFPPLSLARKVPLARLETSTLVPRPPHPSAPPLLRLFFAQVPCFSQDQLLQWHRDPRTRDRVVRHVWRLADLNLALMDKMDLVRRTAESARLYGIDFYSVLVRGSQYRVEAKLVSTASLTVSYL